MLKLMHKKDRSLATRSVIVYFHQDFLLRHTEEADPLLAQATDS
jgi:hypothetical protein